PPGGSHRLAGASVVAFLGGRQERDRRDLRTACGAGELEQRDVEVGLAVVILRVPHDLPHSAALAAFEAVRARIDIDLLRLEETWTPVAVLAGDAVCGGDHPAVRYQCTAAELAFELSLLVGRSIMIDERDHEGIGALRRDLPKIDSLLLRNRLAGETQSLL